ncbi:hypothetical protein QMS90_20535, partial [Cronobacter sakazakii]
KKEKKKEKPRVKKRPRDTKNTGKRRKPSGNATASSDKAE